MALRKLKKRNYLGKGYVSVMKNTTTGEIKAVPITKERFEHVGKRLPDELDMPGWERVQSMGGTFKVDTPDSLMGIDECCEVDDVVHAMIAGAKNGEEHQKFTKKDLKATAIADEFEIDEVKLKLKKK